MTSHEPDEINDLFNTLYYIFGPLGHDRKLNVHYEEEHLYIQTLTSTTSSRFTQTMDPDLSIKATASCLHLSLSRASRLLPEYLEYMQVGHPLELGRH